MRRTPTRSIKEIPSSQVLAPVGPERIYGVYYFNREKASTQPMAEDTPEGRVYKKKTERTIKDESEWIGIPVPDAAGGPVTRATRFSTARASPYKSTGFFGCSPRSTARRSSPAVAAILLRVSMEALPICGARTTFSSSRSFGWTLGSSS